MSESVITATLHKNTKVLSCLQLSDLASIKCKLKACAKPSESICEGGKKGSISHILIFLQCDIVIILFHMFSGGLSWLLEAASSGFFLFK